VRDWHREGLLRAGSCFAHALTWMYEPTEGIAVHAEAVSVALMFRSRSFAGGYGPTITQSIAITRTPCAFGGRRPWFRCEVYRNGKFCGRELLCTRFDLDVGLAKLEPSITREGGVVWAAITAAGRKAIAE
jgi:hypothetical protein